MEKEETLRCPDQLTFYILSVDCRGDILQVMSWINRQFNCGTVDNGLWIISNGGMVVGIPQLHFRGGGELS